MGNLGAIGDGENSAAWRVRLEPDNRLCAVGARDMISILQAG